jgi:hypothetical protein
MQMVSPSSFAYFVNIKSCMGAYLDIKPFFFPLYSRTEFEGDGRHAVLQLVGDHPQHVAATIQ